MNIGTKVLYRGKYFMIIYLYTNGQAEIQDMEIPFKVELVDTSELTIM